jgi:hypothetical protein
MKAPLTSKSINTKRLRWASNQACLFTLSSARSIVHDLGLNGTGVNAMSVEDGRDFPSNVHVRVSLGDHNVH